MSNTCRLADWVKLRHCFASLSVKVTVGAPPNSLPSAGGAIRFQTWDLFYQNSLAELSLEARQRGKKNRGDILFLNRLIF